MLVEIFLLVLLGWYVWHRKQGERMRELASKFPGPMSLPIVGDALQFGTSTSEFLADVSKLCDEYAYKDHGTPFRLWVGSNLFIVITSPKDFEIILGSSKLIDKGDIYNFLLPWLGTGLLTSTGPKWRKHRKILTPTFHFKILEEFVEVFNANGSVMVEKLSKKVDGPAFDIYKYITLCALDNICETAMGVKIDAQNDSESVYVTAIRNVSDVVMKRTFKPWLGPDFLFNLTSYKKIHDSSLKVLHDVTTNVIKTRRAEMESQFKGGAAANVSDDGIKKRLAFLDMLIESTFNGSEMTDQDIREEVDTFMFEGHDTTSSGISFALWLLSRNPEIQEKVYQEILKTFPDSTEPLTFRGLQELKYMELVIKETLRLYPSVPVYARQLNDDLELSNGLVAPKGSTVSIAAYMSHRNPHVWPDPLKFDPDRFSPDNIQGRHPYAFVPFSAGPRNCIGQKFAILETKSSLAHILRNFKLLPGSKEPDLVLAAELILVSETGVKVKLVART